jgi:hypothetical protein
MNSRSLTALSSYPNDTSYLSPGHLLIGAPLITLPGPHFTSTTMNSLSRWQWVQHFNQQLWKNHLTTKTAYNNTAKGATSNLNSNPIHFELLLTHDLLPISWKSAITSETFPSLDGHVRGVSGK